MDQSRQIRFLIPPFFLYASLFWGDYVSCGNLFEQITSQPSLKVFFSIVGLGASTIPLGFLIGSIPIALFNLIELLLKIFNKHWSYEVWIKKEDAKKLWNKVTKQEFNFKKTFYASATFDHGILEKGVNSWMMRRWNAFNTNLNCCIALMLAHVIGSFLSVKQSRSWYATTGVIFVALLINAIMAYWKTMKMIEFQANRDFE